MTASTPNPLNPPLDTNAQLIAVFRDRGGDVPAPYADPPPMVLLHVIGRRTGREYVVPMRAMVAGPSLYVFASAHGSATHPDWYRNLVARPDIVIEQGTETRPVHAVEVAGPEREEIFARQVARFPVFAHYEADTGRTIPVIRLDPRPER